MKIRVVRTKRAEAHIARHDVSWAEVMEVVEARHYFRRTARGVTIIGRTADRLLFVVVRPIRRPSGYYRVVTARDATRREKRLLAKRGKRRT